MIIISITLSIILVCVSGYHTRTYILLPLEMKCPDLFEEFQRSTATPTKLELRSHAVNLGVKSFLEGARKA